jgi:hypothetical protein
MPNPFSEGRGLPPRPNERAEAKEKKERTYSKAEVAALKEKVRKLRAELDAASEEFSVALEHQEAEHFADFADPLALPEEWDLREKPVPLAELAKGRPKNFMDVTKKIESALEGPSMYEYFLEDMRNLRDGKFEKPSSVNPKIRLKDVVRQDYPDWKIDDFRAVFRPFSEPPLRESTQSFEEVASLLSKRAEDFMEERASNDLWYDFEEGIRDDLREMLAAQAPESLTINPDDEAAIEKIVHQAAKNEENEEGEELDKVTLMGEVVLDYDRVHETKHFDAAAFKRGLDAFLRTYVPFLKRKEAE